jgi:uncharacterized protein (TIGR00296 family)
MKEETTPLAVEDGLFLLNATKDVILSYLRNKSWVEKPESFAQSLARRQGVFISIVDKVPRETGEVEEYVISRGVPLPSVSLIDAAFSAAVQAAIDLSSNPRANWPLSESFLRLDVVGDLELLRVTNPMKYTELITLGRDGLMVERGHFKGALLPRVPIAQRWTVQDFLSQCCLRAGLMADAWLQGAVRVHKFQTQVFEAKFDW